MATKTSTGTKKKSRPSTNGVARKKRAAPKKKATRVRSIPAPKAVPEIGSDAVKKATGRGWDEWFALLDAAGATRMPHKEIANLLYEKHDVPEWWGQMVTVGYERARGMRKKHERPDGYNISASRTMQAGAAAAFEAWNDARRRAKWLGEEVVMRKANANRNLRITWTDGTSVEVSLWPKGDAKTQVVAQHSKLPSAAAGERMKAYWTAKLRELEQYLS